MSERSDLLRKTFTKNDDIRDAGLTTPASVSRWDDIVYGTDPVRQALDVYRPKAAGADTLPVIVSVHGGGWVYGDKERYQYYCMELAKRGFAVVNFSYRLAPEFPFPAPLEDTNSVFRWVLDHGEEYGLDSSRVFAVGDSAGAHTLALYAAACADPEYAKSLGLSTPPGFRPAGVALNCGPYSFASGAGWLEDYLPEKGSERELELVNVIRHVTPGFPPAYLMTAAGDFLSAQAVPMAAALLENRVPFAFRFYGSGENELGHVFHLNIRTRDAALCNDEECAFFKSLL